MCWNAQVSLNTFLIGTLGIFIGVLYGGLSIPMAFFCFSITLMQFIEFIVWSYYENKNVNYAASVAASLLLWIQPIASMFTIANTGIRTSMLILYGILSLIGHTIQGKKDYSMTRAPNGHLAWNWMSDRTLVSYGSLFVYMLFLFTPILINKNYDLAAVAIGTLSLSLYSYWRENTWGSMWCWIVNAIVFYVVGKTTLA